MTHSYGCWFGAGCCPEYLVELRTEVLSCLSVSFPIELPQRLVAKFQEWKWVPGSGSCQFLGTRCSVPSILYIKYRGQNQGEDTETPLPFTWEDCQRGLGTCFTILTDRECQEGTKVRSLGGRGWIGTVSYLWGEKFLSSYLRSNWVSNKPGQEP